MIVIDDKKPGAAQKPSSPPDVWADWKPQFHKIRKNAEETVHQRQESHSPTESVLLRAHGSTRTEQGRRRITDARLWDAMTPEQQQAALNIAAAYETMGRGLGYITSD